MGLEMNTSVNSVYQAGMEEPSRVPDPRLTATIHRAITEPGISSERGVIFLDMRTLVVGGVCRW